MGLYDRDYYRDEPDGSWGEWLDQRGSVVIIGITCAVFFLQLLTAPRANALATNAEKPTVESLRSERFDPVRRSCDLYTPAVLSGEAWRIFTGFWVHDLHKQVFGFIFGMLMVYMIGRQLETVIGGKEMLVFYLFAGLVTMLLLLLGKLLGKYVFANAAAWPFDFESSSVGSAGPVAAIVMLFGLKFWDQPMKFIGDSPIPVWIFLAVLFGISFLLKLSSPDRFELIATELFGILAAWVYQKMGWRLSARLALLNRSNGQRKRTRLKLVPAPEDDEDPTEPELTIRSKREVSAVESGDPVDEQLEAKLDRVLDKVSRSGQDSLTSDEKRILLQASEVYKKKRSK